MMDAVKDLQWKLSAARQENFRIEKNLAVTRILIREHLDRLPPWPRTKAQKDEYINWSTKLLGSMAGFDQGDETEYDWNI